MTDVVIGQDPRFGGGAAAQMSMFVDAARSIGHDPELVYLAHPSLVGEHRGVRPPFGHLDALNQLWGARRLVTDARRGNSLWVVATTAQYGAAAARSGRPYAAWIGTSLSAENEGRARGLRRSRRLAMRANEPVLTRLERTVLRAATAVYATSPASRAELAEAGGIDESRIGVLPLTVDVDAFTPIPDDEYLARIADPVLLFVGRADDPRKNLALARAAAQLVPRATLHVVGTGRAASIADELRNASVLVLPSRQEGFGIVVAEALAAGVPVVSTPSGGPEALLEQSGGGAVTDGWSPEEFAAAIVQLLDEGDALLDRRRRGREHVVREHSPQALASALEEAWLDA